jgi:hypothetical protein
MPINYEILDYNNRMLNKAMVNRAVTFYEKAFKKIYSKYGNLKDEKGKELLQKHINMIKANELYTECV